MTALQGIKVIDAATIWAAPMIGTLLGDYGADVIKIEHPDGDGLRKWAWHHEGESLWWAVAGRNKRNISVKLSDARGAEILKELVRSADVLIENFRPGTFERWGLSPEELLTINPRLVMVRVSGFGQTGPYRDRPGFGTLAEAMSGFADTNGPADGPPVLPQWPLADGVAALAGAFATMLALRHAEQTGRGQVVDLSIYEPLFFILGAQTTAYDQLGHVPVRQGSRTDFNVPRGCYRTKDGEWIALSGATRSTAERIMRTVGREDIAQQAWFEDIDGRFAHRDVIDDAISTWVGQRERDGVLAIFGEVGATVGPVYSAADIASDPHFLERGTIEEVEHPALGPIRMQGMIARLSESPGSIRSPGRPIGSSNEEVLLGELGYSRSQLEDLQEGGVIGVSADHPVGTTDHSTTRRNNA